MSILKRKEKEDERQFVTCSECCYAVRDIGGRSFSHETGEYFMGVCKHGCPKADVPSGKVFMNKPRHCSNFIKKKYVDKMQLQKKNMSFWAVVFDR